MPRNTMHLHDMRCVVVESRLSDHNQSTVAGDKLRTPSVACAILCTYRHRLSGVVVPGTGHMEDICTSCSTSGPHGEREL